MRRSVHDCPTTPAVRRLRARRSQRGEIYFESLIAIPIVLFFFVQVWQLNELFVANLVLGHAANAAARAAAVVGPDDPARYDDEDVDDLSDGTVRMDDVTMAAQIVAASATTLDIDSVTVEADQTTFAPNNRNAPLDAIVSADFMCPSWLSLVCLGSDTITLEKTVTFPYQGASYEYE
jgi:Flp pilus assembly protein TadG